MRAIKTNERIRVHRQGMNAIPLEFSWRGRRYDVRRVEKMGGASEKSNRGRTYQLQTVQGLKCRISHEERGDIWRFEHILGHAGG